MVGMVVVVGGSVDVVVVVVVVVGGCGSPVVDAGSAVVVGEVADVVVVSPAQPAARMRTVTTQETRRGPDMGISLS